MRQARLRLAALGTVSVLASFIGANQAWATQAPPDPEMAPAETPSELRIPGSPTASHSPTASPTISPSPTATDPTTMLRHAIMTTTSQAKSSSGTFHYKSGNNEATGDYQFQSKPAVLFHAKATDVTKNGESSSARPELIVNNGVAYVNSAGLVPAMASSPWWKVNLTDLKSPKGMFIAKMFDSATITNPATVQKLAGAYENVKNEGQDEVNGTRVTHFRATYNVDTARAAVGAGGPSPGEAHKLKADIWVDKHNMIRQTQYRNEEGQKPQFDITSTVTDFNKPVTVQTPPANQVQPVPPQLLKQLGLA